jgi:hypothetical protein
VGVRSGLRRDLTCRLYRQRGWWLLRDGGAAVALEVLGPAGLQVDGPVVFLGSVRLCGVVGSRLLRAKA